MAREVAVDVASHSPQVDPILDDLADALADLQPDDTAIPYYSATLYDPREQPAFDADYWVDNLRHTVRFAAAVQAALEDGYRVFAELAPHPLLTHAVEQTARSLDIAVAALAGMRREQALPHGLRGFVADLHSAGAAVDFSVLYPGGRWWTRRCRPGPTAGCSSTRDGQDSPAHGGPPSRCIRCSARTCGCPRSRSATSGRARSAPRRSRGWPTTRSTTWPHFPAPPTARWRWPRPARVSARRPKSATSASSRCCCSTTRPASAPSPRSTRPASSTSWWRPTRTANATGGPPRCCTPPRMPTTSRPRYDIAALLAAHPSRLDGAELRQSVRRARHPATVPPSPVWPPRTPPTRRSARVLAEVALPGSIRSQQAAYGVHPALLDACFQSVCAHPDVAGGAATAAAAAARRPPAARATRPTRNARYCYARVTIADATGVSRPTSTCWTSTGRCC